MRERRGKVSRVVWVRLEDKGEVSEVVGGEVCQVRPERRTCGAMEGHDRVGGEVARGDPPGDVKVEVGRCPGSEAAWEKSRDRR